MNCRLAVLLSGSGTTLENIFSRIEEGNIPGTIEIVIGTAKDAYGLVRAENRNVPTSVINPRECDGTDDFSDRLTEILDSYNVDLVILAGFMFLYRIPDSYKGKVVNVHPSLIPSFCGKGWYGHHVHEAVIERGVRLTGCTVHFVDNIYDNGPIIIQKPVEVLEGDTPDVLAERVQAAEREIYPEAIRLFCEGRLRIDGSWVTIQEGSPVL